VVGETDSDFSSRGEELAVASSAIPFSAPVEPSSVLLAQIRRLLSSSNELGFVPEIDKSPSLPRFVFLVEASFETTFDLLLAFFKLATEDRLPLFFALW
jgi:hypothetical protein